MVNNKLLLIVAAVVIVVGAYFIFLAESPEDRVRAQFDTLAELVHKDANEPPLAGAAKAKGISNLFVDGCVIEISAGSLSGEYSRQAIMERAIMARSYFNVARLQFLDMRLAFSDDRTARVNLTGHWQGSSKSGDHVSEARELNCVLQEIGGEWLFMELIEVEVLQK